MRVNSSSSSSKTTPRAKQTHNFHTHTLTHTHTHTHTHIIITINHKQQNNNNSNLHTVGIKHKEKLWEALGEWKTQYGSVYKFFFGGNVKVVLSCPEMVRLVCVKHFRSFHDRELMYAPAPKALLTVRDSQISWST